MIVRPLARLLPTLGRRTQIMGILNVTPDSFSDGGRFQGPEASLDRALELFDGGADLLDVGGESTRPGAPAVSAEVEAGRVLPVVEALAQRGIGPISIDTSKAEVARRALDLGAAMINDVSGGTFDPAMLPLAASRGVPIVLMHTRSRPEQMQAGSWSYEGGVVAFVKAALRARLVAALEAGVAREAVVLDPGIGFGKTLDENLALIAGLGAFADLECPLLVGTSRKSFIGTLTGKGVAGREFGTAATVALAISFGADLVRVHDVHAMGDVVRVADALVRRRPS